MSLCHGHSDDKHFLDLQLKSFFLIQETKKTLQNGQKEKKRLVPKQGNWDKTSLKQYEVYFLNFYFAAKTC